MTLDDVKTLMETMAKTELTCLDWESAGSSLHLERQPAGPAVNSNEYHAQTGLSLSETASTENFVKKSGEADSRTEKKQSPGSLGTASYQNDGNDADSEQAEPEDKPGSLIKSPVVGIYYSAPSPDNDPFITVGSKIEAGTTLCIIEAMKLMNEVTSSFEGEIAEILVENGQRVEFGQPLFRII